MPKRPPAGSKSSRAARNQGASVQRPGSKKRVFSIRWIISGAAIALTSITVLAVGGLAERNAREALDRELRTRLMLEARNVALTSSGALLSEFPELTLTPILSALREEQPELAFAVVVDHEGEVRGHPDARKIGTKFELPHGLVSAGRATELGEEEQIAVNADVMLAAVPVKRAGGHRIGTALVAVQRAYVDELISEARRKQAILVAVLLVAGIVSAATLVSFLLRPVSVLREGLERIGRGDLETPVRLKDRTELGLLAETMNEMSHRLRDAQEEKLEKERLSREVELAREIQSSLLPTGGLEVNGFVIDGSQQSALEVGGDYYDIFPLEDGRVGIAVADVSGKGLAGCLVTSMLSALLRAFRNTETSPSALLVRLEENLKDSLRPGTFITMFYGTLDPERGSLNFASAGHSPLLVHRGETGEAEWYKTTGIPIGAIRNGALGRSLSDHTIWLGPRDLIVQYTDGINEAFDVTGEHQFGFERLEKAAAAAAPHGCRAVLDGVREAVRTWAGDHPPDDDETLLVVGRQPVAAKATPRAAGPEKFAQVRFSSSVMAHNPVTLLHLAKTRGRHLPLTADLDGLAVLPGWLATCPGFETLDSREAVVVETGVYEAAANIIEHGYGKDPSRSFDLWWLPRTTDGSKRGGTFVLLDHGVAFRPAGECTVDFQDPAVRRRGRGLGLEIIRGAMSRVSYHPGTPAGNITILGFEPEEAREEEVSHG